MRNAELKLIKEYILPDVTHFREYTFGNFVIHRSLPPFEKTVEASNPDGSIQITQTAPNEPPLCVVRRLVYSIGEDGFEKRTKDLFQDFEDAKKIMELIQQKKV